MDDAVKQLTLTQQIALQKCQEELALARRNLNRAQGRFNHVLTECGLEPGIDYDVTPDGIVTVVVQEDPSPKAPELMA